MSTTSTEQSIRNGCNELLEKADTWAQKDPLKSTGCAFGVGFLLNFLPFGTIAAALTTLVLALVKPFLLFLGAIKACELISSPRTDQPSKKS